jgi:hypothetical protein
MLWRLPMKIEPLTAALGVQIITVIMKVIETDKETKQMNTSSAISGYKSTQLLQNQ